MPAEGPRKEEKNPEADAKAILKTIREVHPESILMHIFPTKPRLGFEIEPAVDEHVKERLIADLGSHPIEVQTGSGYQGKKRVFLMRSYSGDREHSALVLEALERLILKERSDRGAP